MSSWYENARFLLHLHHGYSLDGPVPGSGFHFDVVRARLAAIRPDAVHYTAKGQSGYVPYPTAHGNGLVSEDTEGWVDVLAGYRDITRELGIAFIVGYSGLIDARAGSYRPDWLRIASNYNAYPNRALCPNAGYVDDLMLPQLAEILERYDPDGIWVDGENWTVSPCYCTVCTSEYQMMHERSAPVERSDPSWPQWLDFHRESFERYLNRVTRYLNDRKEGLVYASNGAYGTLQPARPTHGLGRLTWDLSPAYSLRQAGLEARFFDRQGLPFDLQTPTRCSPRPHAVGRQAALPSYPKTADHLLQEGAAILASGGRWGVWVNAYGDDSLPPSELELARKAAGFARERSAWSHGTESGAYVAVLHSDTTHRRAGNGLFDSGPCLDRIRGAHQALAELHHFHDVVTWETLSRSLELYSVIILPEQVLLPNEADDALIEWVRGGGQLIASGRVSPRIVEDVPTFALEEALGVRWSGRQDPEGWYQHRGLPLRVAAPTCQVVPHGAETLTVLLRGPHEEMQEGLGYPAVTRHSLGEGAAFYIASDLFTAYHRSQYPGLREVLEDVLSQALPLAPFTTDAPPSVEMTLRLRGSEMLLHLVNGSPGKSLAQNSAFIEAVPPAGPVTVGMAIPAAPKSVSLPVEGAEPRWSYADQVLTVEIPPFHLHTVLRVETEPPPPVLEEGAVVEIPITGEPESAEEEAPESEAAPDRASGFTSEPNRDKYTPGRETEDGDGGEGAEIGRGVAAGAVAGAVPGAAEEGHGAGLHG